jgi:hypothetical protein
MTAHKQRQRGGGILALLLLTWTCIVTSGQAQGEPQGKGPEDGGLGGRGRYLVLQLTRLGLANRLRSMADMHSLALASDRTLLVSWKPNADCNASFFDLFEGGGIETGKGNSMQVLPLVLEDGDEGIIAVKGMAAENGLSYRFLPFNFADFYWPQEVFASDVDVLHTVFDGVLTTENVRCQQYASLHSRFLSSLVPIASVRRMVQEIDAEYFQDRLSIGVHIRGHDTKYDWEVVPPAPGR